MKLLVQQQMEERSESFVELRVLGSYYLSLLILWRK